MKRACCPAHYSLALDTYKDVPGLPLLFSTGVRGESEPHGCKDETPAAPTTSEAKPGGHF